MIDSSISNPPTSFPTERIRRLELFLAQTRGSWLDPTIREDIAALIAAVASPQLQSTEAVERALLKWHMPTMLRWLAENITEPRLPDGTLTGRFLYAVAENIEYRTTSPAVVEDPHSDEVERMREMIVELWHDAKGEHGDLHQCLGMTWKQYQDWVVPANKEGGE